MRFFNSRPSKWLWLSLLLALFHVSSPAQAQPSPTQACRIEGFRGDVQCGSIKRPLDPASPNGVQIDIHYVVIPAIARNKLDDAVFFFAGGPGQSAIKIAALMMSRLGRLNSRRDVVFIDQRGTGKSAPLVCKPSDEERAQPLASAVNEDLTIERMQRCHAELEKLPYGKDGGLSYFYSEIALKDADAVRAALGYPKINLIGGSYGSRAALEYMRQFPDRVRRSVIDGLAPPDMVLVESFGTDMQAAFDAMLSACEKDVACSKRYPELRSKFTALVSSLPKQVTTLNPSNGRSETFTLTVNSLANSLRSPLYMPSLTSALPYALAEASEGRFTALVSLAGALSSGAGDEMAVGMHLSVVCAEDFPLAGKTAPEEKGKFFGNAFTPMYQRLCPSWFGTKKPVVPEAFYKMPAVNFPTLVLSGGADPVTPPRHGERVTKALGAKAKHVIAPEVGHIVMGQGCARELVSKFIDAKTDDDALKLDEKCIDRLKKIPRASVYLPPALFNQTENKLGEQRIMKGVQ